MALFCEYYWFVGTVDHRSHSTILSLPFKIKTLGNRKTTMEKAIFFVKKINKING